MQNLYLYDTLSAKKTKFTPIKKGQVGLYVCGMTVYDYCHIGHARVMVSFDVIYRWLRHIGYDVTYIRNITDIDDKIIARAAKNGESIQDLTNRFIIAMHEDAKNLHCLAPTKEPKATEYIDKMQQMIQTLQDKNFAYQGANGDVYYAVNKFASYGKLSKRNLDDMQAGARVAIEDDKQSVQDFVLWKAAKQGEPSWQSAWGDGRPGWHIECSAMSTCCLGENFDIHGGGHDLQFPHHENEIAQSEGATGKPYANYWMHVGFVNVDGEKMSKSLNNFFTIREVLEQFCGETVRFFILSSHYKSPINFSDAALKQANNALSRLYFALKGIDAVCDDALFDSDFGQRFTAAMNDDFNSAKAVGILFEVASALNLAQKNNDANTQYLANVLKTLGGVLGILQTPVLQFLQHGLSDAVDESYIIAQINARAQAKKDKNFALADKIRNELKAQNIELEDSRQGTTWRVLQS